MIKYTLEDGFEFVTNDTGVVVRTKSPEQTRYQKEGGLGIRVTGSVSVEKRDHLDDIANISNPALVGEYLIVQGELAPPSSSPTKISSIDYKSGLAKRIADFYRAGKAAKE